jgi:hypothetical protein
MRATKKDVFAALTCGHARRHNNNNNNIIIIINNNNHHHHHNNNNIIIIINNNNHNNNSRGVSSFGGNGTSVGGNAATSGQLDSNTIARRQQQGSSRTASVQCRHGCSTGLWPALPTLLKKCCACPHSSSSRPATATCSADDAHTGTALRSAGDGCSAPVSGFRTGDTYARSKASRTAKTTLCSGETSLPARWYSCRHGAMSDSDVLKRSTSDRWCTITARPALRTRNRNHNHASASAGTEARRRGGGRRAVPPRRRLALRRGVKELLHANILVRRGGRAVVHRGLKERSRHS